MYAELAEILPPFLYTTQVKGLATLLPCNVSFCLGHGIAKEREFLVWLFEMSESI